MCLIARKQLHREQIPSGFKYVASPALAGLLALLLLVAGMLSVSQCLHQALHPEGAGSDHSCLVCSLVKGQVSAVSVAAVMALLVLCCFSAVLCARISPLPGFDYRLSPSRAPPTLALLTSALA